VSPVIITRSIPSAFERLKVGDRTRGVRSHGIGGGNHTRGTPLDGNQDDALAQFDEAIGCLLERVPQAGGQRQI
jgi:hypothetical protein